jgi:hypothetical protein
MKNFDAKWRVCAARAGQAQPRDEQAPFGFAARVVARRQSSPRWGLEPVWERLALRVLWGAAALLVICTLIEVPQWRQGHVLNSGVEDCVAQVIWTL